MRTGAIFARGSCRALKWVALFGVVFALGVGQAAAQIEPVAIKSVAIEHADGKVVGENVETFVVVTLEEKVPSANNGADPPVDAGDTTVALTVAISGLDGSTGQAEAGEDLRLNNVVATNTTEASATFDEGDTVVRIPLETLNDPDAVDEEFTLTARLGAVTDGGAGTGAVTANTDPKVEEFTIDDDETQTYVFDLVGQASAVKEDAPFTVNLYADPGRPASEDVTLYVRLESGNDDDELGGTNPRTISDVGGTEAAPLGLLVTPDDNDGNRTDDDVMLMVSTFNDATGQSSDIEVLGDHTITILDVHQLPAAGAITAEIRDKAEDGDEIDPAVVKEGEKVYLFVTLENKTDDRVSDTEEFTITPMVAAANIADVRITPALLKVSGAGEPTTDAFTVEAIADNDINIDANGMAVLENIELTLDVAGVAANGGGNVDPPAMSSIGIEDVTVAQVSVAEGAYAHIMEQMGEDPLNRDDEFSLMTSELFTYEATMYDVSYGVSVSGAGVSASSGGDMVTVMASGVTPADGAKVTVTATATPKASSFVITQTQDNVAQLTFPVTVVLADLTVEVTADPMEIDEGGMSTITAKANRMVDASDGDVTVNLQVVGDATLSAESITIAAGSDSGSVELTATEDDLDYENEEVTVVVSGAASDTITINVMDNDEAPVVPATVTAKSQDEVDAVFAAAVGDGWTEGGEAAMVDMSALFDTESTSIIYSAESSDAATVMAATSGMNLTLTPVAAGSATVTVTAADTDSGDSAMASSMVTVNAIVLDPVVVTGVTAEPMEVMEGGTTTITATTNRAIDEATMLTLDVVGDEDAYMVADMLEIPADMTSGSVELTASQDDDYMNESLTVIVTGPGITGAMRVEIAVTDDDDAPVDEPTVRAEDGAAAMIADAIATVAGGAPWMVGGMAATVDMSMLFDVDDGVTAAYSGGSSDDAVVSTQSSGTTLTLTPMGAGTATITVTGSDAASGSVATVSHDAMVALQTLSITVTASADTVAEGGSVTLTAAANRAVTEAAMLTVTVTGDAAAVDADAMITIAMGEMSGTGTVMAVEDDDSADAMVSVVVSGAGIAGGAASFDIAITDNDPTVSGKSQAEVTAVFVTAIAMAGGADGWLPGGNAATVDMSELFDTNDGPTVEYTAESSAEDTVGASASGSTLTLTPVATGDATISVTASDTSVDDADTATVSATVTVGVLPLEIMVSPTTAEVTEGGTVEITATANKMVDANVEVMLVRDAASSAGEDDYSLAPPLITIMAGDASGMATLTATDDVMVEGDESLTLVARVGDENIGQVVVSIMDNDVVSAFTLSGPMDSNLVEGESYELTVTADPAVQVDTEVTIMRDRGASDADDADFTVGSVMLSAGDAAGTTMLMVTDDGMDDSGHGMPEVLVLYGMADGESTNSLTFNIWDAAVPALPVIAQLLLAAFLAIGGYRRYRRR